MNHHNDAHVRFTICHAQLLHVKTPGDLDMACIICTKATVPQRRAMLQSKSNSHLIPALFYLIEKALQTEETSGLSRPTATIEDIHQALKAGTLNTYLCSKCCTKLSHFSDVEKRLVDSLKEGSIVSRIASLVTSGAQSQLAGSKRNLEDQHTPKSKKQKRTAPLSVRFDNVFCIILISLN